MFGLGVGVFLERGSGAGEKSAWERERGVCVFISTDNFGRRW